MEGKVTVFRYNPEVDQKPRYETYSFPYQAGMTVLDVAFYINENIDGEFGFSYCCRNSHCGLCGAKINNRPGLMCREAASKEFTLEPLAHFPVIRDIIIDREEYDRRKANLRLFLERIDPAEKLPEYIDPNEHDKFKVASRCVECYSCVADCPVISELPHEFLGPAGLVQLARHSFDPRDEMNREVMAFSSGLYNCTTCGRCEVVCPHHIAPVKNIEMMREKLDQKNLAPKAVQELKELLAKNQKALNLSQGHEPLLKEQKLAQSPVGLFIGCNLDYDYRLQPIVEATVAILKKLGLEVVMPHEQVCCGQPAQEMGAKGEMKSLVLKNIELFKASDVQKVITLCGGCGSAGEKLWPEVYQNEYQSKLPFEILDISQFLYQHIDKIKWSALPLKIAYHQACSLHRGQKVADEPQKLLAQIPELEIIATETDDSCCGGGGGLRLSNQKLSQRITTTKLKGIANGGVEMIVTGCPTCIKQLNTGLARNKMRKVKVEHLVTVLAKSIVGKEG